ncbi:MAG: glycosyltransferase [Chitinivibrionales bacterium]|nr:glycosyltransferase [Chitinivibrionales bacterium]
MLKNLHIITRLIRGGADESVLSLVMGLEEAEYEVMLLVGGDSDPVYIEQYKEHVNILQEPSLRRNIKLFCDLLSFCRIYQYIKKEKFDIVHTHTAKAGFIGRIAAKLAGVPIIIHTVHGITFHEFTPPIRRTIYLAFEKIAASITDKFIAVGRDLQNYYLRNRIGRSEQYSIIHTGMDIERFYQAGNLPVNIIKKKRLEFQISSKSIIIGKVARLDFGKGQQYLIQAAPKIINHFPDAKFIFAGEGPYRKKLETMVKDLALDDHVLFTGFRRDIEEMIAMFDIAVFTSLWEGLPRVVVQYIAVGKPVVAFDIDGVAELVKNGVNGFTVPAKDVDQLAKRIIELLDHLPNSRIMGKNGRRFIDESWGIDRMVTEIDQEYQLLLKKKHHDGSQSLYC